jgi:hypothetical protein
MITRKKDLKIEKASGEEDVGDGEDKPDWRDAQDADQYKDNYMKELQWSWRGDNMWKIKPGVGELDHEEEVNFDCKHEHFEKQPVGCRRQRMW